MESNGRSHPRAAHRRLRPAPGHANGLHFYFRRRAADSRDRARQRPPARDELRRESLAKLARLARGFANGGTIPQQYWRLSHYWNFWGVLAILLPLAVVYLMVFKGVA
jgi:hypothetical protein